MVVIALFVDIYRINMDLSINDKCKKEFYDIKNFKQCHKYGKIGYFWVLKLLARCHP